MNTMDQEFKDSLHTFMIGLEVVLVGGVLSLLVLYFVIKYRIKKKKALEKQDQV